MKKDKYLFKHKLSMYMKRLVWIYHYAKNYWFFMVLYTILGMTGTLLSLFTSFVSKELIDIITGHETGKIVYIFTFMILLNVITTLISQISSYLSLKISMKVDTEIKADIFEKILVTDWEALTTYHTGDLLTRWSNDASSLSSSTLYFIPNAIISLFKFVSALCVILYYDWTFALFAFIGMPVSMLMSKTLIRRMVNNNAISASMVAKMSGFNQEAFSNIQTIKAFDLTKLYVINLRRLQKEYIEMKLNFQRLSIGTSIVLSTVGMLVSYISYGWGIYRVWSGVISYGTMTMFLSLSNTLTNALQGVTSLVPTTISMTTSAGRLMDIVEMPREDYSNDELVEKFLEDNKATGISLKMKDVDYAYKTGTLVFEGASMEVNPHEIIALVGPSGEGKTTMLRLVLSLMQTRNGTAYLTGEHTYSDLFNEENRALESEEIFSKYNAVPLTPSTRKLFSYVPQGNTMFSGTIAENMRNV